MTHWAYFTTDDDRENFKKAVTPLGYRIESESEDPEDEYSRGVCFARFQSVNLDEIDQAVIELFRLARRFRGSYDGWETQILSDRDDIDV